MNNTMKHTPTPWEVAEHKPGDKWLSILEASVEIDIDDFDEEGMKEQFANAAFIVRAVNSHAELVAALEHTKQFLHEVHCRWPEDAAYGGSVLIGVDAALKNTT